MKKTRVAIGIPCFDGLAVETQFDYIRMFYAFGRMECYQEYDFFLLYKLKSEQFRARNNIVEGALQVNADYLLFLDDDQVIDWVDTATGAGYDFLKKLLDHKKDIIGALYYHRGGRYAPVLMKKVMTAAKKEAYSFIPEHEILFKLQEVDVQGGGCMLIDMKVFDKIKPPYFEPEMGADVAGFSTDIQLCRRAQQEGFSVWCDTSVQLGHVENSRVVVTTANRDSCLAAESYKQGHLQEYMLGEWYKNYVKDICEFSGIDKAQLEIEAAKYDEMQLTFNDYENHDDYYRAVGMKQVYRQAWFHSLPNNHHVAMTIFNYLVSGMSRHGLDYGCGTAPVGFHIMQAGHKMDFVDVEGAKGIEFVKWRAEKSSFGDRAGYKVQGPYDFVMMLDSLEHIKDWERVLDNVLGRMISNGLFVTNYFKNKDYNNAEHINLSEPRKQEIHEFMVERKFAKVAPMVWVKHDNFMGGASNVRNT